MNPLDGKVLSRHRLVRGISRRRRFSVNVMLWYAVVFLTSAPAQDFSANGLPAHSVSGQFVVTGPPGPPSWQDQPEVITNTSLVRLSPAVLAVSAERIKASLYHLLGVASPREWRGKIHLSLQPAWGTNETVTVMTRPGDPAWSYQVQMPEVVPQARFIRAMTGVLLLELANRQPAPDGHPADIPDWLITGLSRQMAQDELAEVVLSSPEQPRGVSPAERWRPKKQELDPLAGARRVLRRHPALTIDQLSWPTAGELDGADDGVYDASAQLLVAELLKLRGGPARLQQMLAGLPACYNWQTAFQNTFHDWFARPLDVEKWWALQVAAMQAQDAGLIWTPSESAARLDDLVLLPVETRPATNAFPDPGLISLQTAVRSLAPAQQAAGLPARLAALRTAQRHMPPAFRALTEDYCRVLADYLALWNGPVGQLVASKHSARPALLWQAGLVIQNLDELDVRRRALKAAVSKEPAPPPEN